MPRIRRAFLYPDTLVTYPLSVTNYNLRDEDTCQGDAQLSSLNRKVLTTSIDDVLENVLVSGTKLCLLLLAKEQGGGGGFRIRLWTKISSRLVGLIICVSTSWIRVTTSSPD